MVGYLRLCLASRVREEGEKMLVAVKRDVRATEERGNEWM